MSAAYKCPHCGGADTFRAVAGMWEGNEIVKDGVTSHEVVSSGITTRWPTVHCLACYNKVKDTMKVDKEDTLQRKA